MKLPLLAFALAWTRTPERPGPARWLRLGAGLGLALLFGLSPVATVAQGGSVAAAAQDGATEAPARVIVRFRNDSALVRRHAMPARASAAQALATITGRAQALGVRLGMALRPGRALSDHVQVIHADGVGSEALVERLSGQPDIEYAFVDYRRTHLAEPNDPLYSRGPSIAGTRGGPVVGQWYLHAPGTDIVSAINAPGAWAMTTGSPAIVVAVLDTGVRPEHPDLAGRLLPGYNMISDAAVANDGDGRDPDASDPGDWVTATQATSRRSQFFGCGASDSSWHGTMTASLIGAASNDGIGMAGLAWGVKLLPVRVLGKCGGYDSDIIAGMRWAAGLSVPGVPENPYPARVINLSLGGRGTCSQSYRDAINAILGKPDPAVIVAAAGNSTGLAVGAPANCPGVIGVGGLRHSGTKVGFSDLGPEITISAPGGNCVNSGANQPCQYPILAATNTGLTSPVASSYTDGFNYSIGTSFSAPLVTGTVALMLSVQPGLTPAQVKSVLQSTARAFPTASASTTLPVCRAPNAVEQLECRCTTYTCGAGMLDAAAAVAAVALQSPQASTRMADCLFDWAEKAYPTLFAPRGPVSSSQSPYYYRYYSGTGNYLATSAADNHVWVYGPGFGNNLLDVGPAAGYTAAAGCTQ